MRLRPGARHRSWPIPTPAFSSGTLFITDSVAGAMTLAMEAAMSSSVRATIHSSVVGCQNDIETSSSATAARAPLTVRRVPTRAPRRTLMPAPMGNPTASGSIMRPASSASDRGPAGGTG